MAMGNLTSTGFPDLRIGSYPSGTFRGSTRMRVIVEVFRQVSKADDAPITLSAYVTACQTSKSINGQPGTWSVTFKGPRMVPGTATSADLSGLISPDDWVRISFTENAANGRVWPVMVGLVDVMEVARGTVDSAPTTTYRLSGRDLTKPLAETVITSATNSQFDPVLSIGAFYNALAALERVGQGFGRPDTIVVALLRFLMGAEGRPQGVSFWRVPLNFQTVFIGGRSPNANGRQFTDVLDVASYVTPNLAGTVAINGSFLAASGSGNQVLDTLRAYANDTLNEMWVDLLPSVPGGARSPIAYYTPDGDEARFVPALVLREKPFYSLPGSVAHRGANNDPWSQLPTTTISALDLEEIKVSRGSDLFNFFLVETGGVSMPLAAIIEQSIARGETVFEGIPAIDRDSVQIHGLRRMELRSNYVGTGGQGDLSIFAGWTRLVRDWYAANPEYYSGSITSATLLPGVRVGERLIVTDPFGYGGTLQFYVEGVDHTIQMVGGVASHRTTLTVTRGHPNPPAAVTKYAERFKPRGRSALGAQGAPLLDDASRDAIARAVALQPTPAPAQVVGGPQGVQGTAPDGASFDVPSAEE